MTDPSDSSPSKSDIAASPSIYAYQTRLMGGQGLAGIANGSTPSTNCPSRGLSRMNSLRDQTTAAGLRRSGSGARIGLTHGGRGKSVDLARGQWEAKIEASATELDAAPSPRPRSMMATPGVTQASPPVSSTAPSASTSSPLSSRLTADSSRLPSGSSQADRSQRATVIGMSGWNPSSLSSASTIMSSASTATKVASPPRRSTAAAVQPDIIFDQPAAQSSAAPVKPKDAAATDADLPTLPRTRPASMTSYTSTTPDAVETSVAAGRSKTAADTLAEARANALRRLEAKKKAQAGGDSAVSTPTKEETHPQASKVEVPVPATFELASTDKAKAEDCPPGTVAQPLTRPSRQIPTNDSTKTLQNPATSSTAQTLRGMPSLPNLAKTPSVAELREQAALRERPSVPKLREARSISTLGDSPATSEVPTMPKLRQAPSVSQLRELREAASSPQKLEMQSTPKTGASLSRQSSVAERASMFGSRARQESKTEDTPSGSISHRREPSVTGVSDSLAKPSPFGDRVKIASRPAEPLVASPGKFEAPVLRKVKSIDLGATESPKPPTTPSKGPTKTADLGISRTPQPAPAAGDVFSPARPSLGPDTSSPSKPKFAGLSFRAPTGPPKGSVSSMASRFASGDAGAPAPKARVPSLGVDRRRLGKHLPRIVSGDQGWEGDSRRTSHARKVSMAKDRKSSLSRAPVVNESTEENTPPRAAAETIAPQTPRTPTRSTPQSSRTTPLAPLATVNRQTPSKVPRTPSKISSSFTPQTPKTNFHLQPRAEVTGEDMKGLMHAIGAATPVRKADDEGVAGTSNRLRLSRLPLAASSAKLAPAPLPSRRLAGNNWMDRQRHDLAAYEYLCHIGEAQQWIEGCLDEELEFGVTEMEQGLRDGVVLAKLARVYEGEQVVKRIWTEAKHRFRQSDNINYFLNFVRNIGMPEIFIFELTDLYNGKNIPKAIFCIHVLSHLLARLGRAERMNNLVGQFEFTDEQLAATEKGLQGVAMPNFQQVGQTLAKEASWEPEEEEEQETEDEKRDRELLECEPSIIACQQQLRGALARQRKSRVKAQLKLVAPMVKGVQSQARGHITRKKLSAEKNSHQKLGNWATSLQAAARAHLVAVQWNDYSTSVRTSSRSMVGVQAHARGRLARLRRRDEAKRIESQRKAIVAIQATCRGSLVRRNQKADRKAFVALSTVKSVTTMQAALRGRLTRQAVAKQMQVVYARERTFVALQSHLRGALVRRHVRAHEKKMDDAADYIVAIQAAARGMLTRQRKKVFTRDMAKVTVSLSGLQAIARGRLAKRQHENMQKALTKVEVAGSVGGLQAFLRSKLAKRQTVEQKKKLEFVQPDVIGFQAVARGYLARQEYREWRDYLVDPHTQGALVFLQSLMRGFLARRRLWMRLRYLYANQDKIVKVQSIWRGRKQRLMYDRLITSSGVDVLTIQNYMHLLDDTEVDFHDQLRIDTLRKDVVELLRTNQTLETEVQELDTKIALILKNKMSFEDLVRAKRRHGAVDESAFQTPGGGDPFVGVHLDRATQRKLELYEHLFFTLQTQPKYISRLLHQLNSDPDMEKDARLVEGVTLILFGFGHDRREEYLFHKLLQISIHEQILRSRSLEDLANSRFAVISVTAQYVKPLLTPYVQNVLWDHINRVVQAEELDLSTDPVDMYNRLINAEESLTGVKSVLPRDLTADQILQSHGETRTLYIHHLQELRALADLMGKAIMASTAQMPYTIRLLAREALLALRVRYRDVEDSELWPVVAKAIILPFILPAIVAPETYGIAENVNPIQRRNLSTIANLLGHVAAQNFHDLERDRLVRVPLDEFIRAAGRQMGDWIFDVAEVDFQVQEMLESTSEATPIAISRSDIYGLLSILMRNVPVLTAGKASDPIESVLDELEGPPIDYDRSKNTVRVRLTNRLATLQTSDPHVAAMRELEVQAKRHVIAVLRVQTGRDLFKVLLKHPTEEDEQKWIYEVHRDIALEQARRERHDLPPTPAETEYQMESIRSLPFHEVKARAVEFCMGLVEAGRLSRDDQFAGLLVSIAQDIKEKHRMRQKRKVDLSAMSEAHAHLSDKRQKFEEQIQSYHDYIDTAMAALQQKKKAPFMSKQYWHQRGSGKKTKFGSYKYSAADLYEKGILLSVTGYSPRQFNSLHLVIGSNVVGVFVLEMTAAGGNNIGREEMRMEDLLQAQFDNNVRLDMFDGTAAFNLNMLIHQINKKFYSA